MKTITVQELSTTRISLFDANLILSSFSSSADNGASNTVCAYLRRTASAFSELAQLHKDRNPDRKHKKKPKLEEQQPIQGPGEEEVNHEVKHKKKNKRHGGEVKIEEAKLSQVCKPKLELKNHEIKHDTEGQCDKENKKKRKSREIEEDDRKNNSAEQQRKKKKKIKSERDS